MLTARYPRTQILRCHTSLFASPSRACTPLTHYSTTDAEERYIQTTSIPTFHFQSSLPRLKIPKLDKTCDRYLAALRPIVDDEQYKATEAIVYEFAKSGGEGEALNKRLVAKDKQNKHTSYITEPWFDMYLKSRDALVLNYNPFIAFKDDPQGVKDQALRAANFIRSAVRFRSSLWEEYLQPEIFHLNPATDKNNSYKTLMRSVPKFLSWPISALVYKSFPLDMSQYNRLLNCTRVPVVGKDELVSFKDESPRHLVVTRNGHFYSLDAVQENGLPVPVQRVYTQLKAILNDNSPPCQHQVGYLTGINRDTWARAREELVASPVNKEVLRCIDSSLFVLCLDESEPESPRELSHIMLHNHGNNRWFDKSFSLIVTKNGQSSINFEHAWGDGVAVLRLFNELFKDASTGLATCSDEPTMDGVSRLNFELSDSMKGTIERARDEVEGNTRRLEVDTLQYQKFGRNVLKKKKISPDAILQMAIQVAYHRLYKSFVSTYESSSTAAFKHGRTETIRSATMATKACAEAFNSETKPGADELMSLIKTSADYHSQLVKDAAMGQGFDRHLFGLKTLATVEELPPLAIFEDPSYKLLNHIILSTSTLSAENVLMGGFAPVTPDGYGIGYSVLEDWIGTQISTYDTRDGAALIEAIEGVLDELYNLFNDN